MKYFNCFCVGILLFAMGEINGQNEMNLSADSLFNLGNAAFNNEQFDQAIFYYEQARLLDPRGKDIAVNLQLANEKLSTDIIEIEPFFLAEWWSGISNLMLPGGWKIVSIVFLVCLLLLIYFHFFKNKIENKTLFQAISGGLIVLFIISILAGNTRTNQIFNSPFAIVFGGDQSLNLGPDIVSEEIKDVTGGNKLKILDEDGLWYKVSAMDSEQGWIKKENVRLIKLDK